MPLFITPIPVTPATLNLPADLITIHWQHVYAIRFVPIHSPYLPIVGPAHII